MRPCSWMRQCNKGRRARLRSDDAGRACCRNVGIFNTEIKLLVTWEYTVVTKPRPCFFFNLSHHKQDTNMPYAVFCRRFRNSKLCIIFSFRSADSNWVNICYVCRVISFQYNNRILWIFYTVTFSQSGSVLFIDAIRWALLNWWQLLVLWNDRVWDLLCAQCNRPGIIRAVYFKIMLLRSVIGCCFVHR